MKTHTPRVEEIRKNMAVMNWDGRKWLVIRGINGAEILFAHKKQSEANNFCQTWNTDLAVRLNTYMGRNLI
jgi:hypothetical protein